MSPTLLATRPLALGPDPQAAACQQITRGPACVNLNLYAGDDFGLSLTVTDEATGDPVDLTGATVTAQVRSSSASTTVLASFTCSVTPPNIITAQLPSAQTQSLPSKAVWDLQIVTSPGNQTVTLVAGTINTTPDVTRPAVP